jgi:hypothetical protein
MGPIMGLACETMRSPLFWSSWRPPLTSSSHGLLFPKINDVTKSVGLFDVHKVPKTQKHAKTRKSALKC